jgi:hypothetical protein
MLESIHQCVLGAFSVYGAILLGRWILGRGWHWAWKFVTLVFVASLVVSGASLMVGGTPDDLRIFTEILASAGAVIAAGNMLARRGVRRSAWAQYGVPIALLVFLVVTWREQIQDLRHGTIEMPTIPISSPPVSAQTTASPAPASGSDPVLVLREFCTQPGLSFDTRELSCKKP